MINLENAREEFKKYVTKYEEMNPKISLKIEHTYKVAENSKKIAQNLNLTEEQQNLAELIGLLHDIGRFEQLRIYNTFLDSASINHAEQGIKVLFEEGLIRNFIKEDKYDDLIYKAIINHNKLQIEPGLTDEELLQAKIIRDADKLDVYRVLLKEDFKNTTAFPVTNIDEEILTDAIYDKFINEQPILYSEMKTNIDHIVVWVTYIYDINYPESIEIIKENDYITKLINRVDFKDTVTKERMKIVKEKANEFIKNKCK